MEQDHWIPTDGIDLEENAIKTVKDLNNVLTYAGPGAGKTELLAQKANYLLETGICPSPYQILAISFKVDAADNIRKRVERRCSIVNGKRFSSYTFDAFASFILKHFRLAIPVAFRPSLNYLIIDNKKHSENTISSKAIDRYFRTLSDFEPDSIRNLLESSSFRPFLRQGTGLPSLLTYKTVFLLALYIVKTNIKIADLIRSTFPFVFVDEFQDTTDLQYSLLSTLFKDTSTSVTAVGDSKQKIMVWAGAKKDIFSTFQKDFSAKDYSLIVNHRSVPELVRFEKKFASLLNNSPIENDYKESYGNVVQYFICENDDIEANVIAQDIAEKIKCGVKPEEICIISKKMCVDARREYKYANKICEQLRKSGIRAADLSQNQEFFHDSLFSLVFSILELSVGNITSEERFEIDAELMRLKNISGNIEDGGKYISFERDFSSLLSNLWHSCIYLKNNPSHNEKMLERVLRQIVDFIGINAIEENYSIYSEKGLISEAVKRFAEKIYSELKFSNFDFPKALDSLRGRGIVHIMTVHKSKGLEYEYVYFIGIEDDSFWQIMSNPSEEYSVFFVGVSRAKKGLILSSSKKRGIQDEHIHNIREIIQLLPRCSWKRSITSCSAY